MFHHAFFYKLDNIIIFDYYKNILFDNEYILCRIRVEYEYMKSQVESKYEYRHEVLEYEYRNAVLEYVLEYCNAVLEYMVEYGCCILRNFLYFYHQQQHCRMTRMSFLILNLCS
jgi:hypothetical protein